MITVVVSARVVLENLTSVLFAERLAIGKCFYSVMLENFGERTNSDFVLGSMNAQMQINFSKVL